MKRRCAWVDENDELYARYHDEEWGVSVHDDRHLFEMLVLEGAQAGLSWRTVLKKREAYRAAFDRFDPAKVARYGDERIASLMANPGIVRNRLKIRSAVKNARAFLAIQKEFGSFDRYIWDFTDGKPFDCKYKSLGDFTTTSPLSDEVSKDLKKRGMTFVGSTIIYAYLQAIGIVNAHTIDCFRYFELR